MSNVTIEYIEEQVRKQNKIRGFDVTVFDKDKLLERMIEVMNLFDSKNDNKKNGKDPE